MRKSITTLTPALVQQLAINARGDWSEAMHDWRNGNSSSETMKMIHKLAHVFGWHYGRPYCWTGPETGALLVGFKCAVCGDITNISPASVEKELESYLQSKAKQ